jgi:hypothetical protein
MENEHSIEQELITKENLPSILAKIAVEREKKGTSEVLIPRIRLVREQVEKLGDLTSVVQLYQEEFLSAQHMIMEEKAKRFKANPFRVAKGMLIMEKTSKNMEQYLDKNSEQVDPIVKNRVFRFLGRLADQKGQYGKSEDYYKKGLSYFDSLTKPEERFNRLEFMGFLSYSLIKQGKSKEGIDLANQTLNDFDQSSEGKWLKENNYYAWAVWKSGIEIRTAEHIFKTKDTKYADIARDFLSDSEIILRMPNGTTENFRLRLDELNNARDNLVKVSPKGVGR